MKSDCVGSHCILAVDTKKLECESLRGSASEPADPIRRSCGFNLGYAGGELNASFEEIQGCACKPDRTLVFPMEKARIPIRE